MPYRQLVRQWISGSNGVPLTWRRAIPVQPDVERSSQTVHVVSSEILPKSIESFFDPAVFALFKFKILINRYSVSSVSDLFLELP